MLLCSSLVPCRLGSPSSANLGLVSFLLGSTRDLVSLCPFGKRRASSSVSRREPEMCPRRGSGRAAAGLEQHETGASESSPRGPLFTGWKGRVGDQWAMGRLLSRLARSSSSTSLFLGFCFELKRSVMYCFSR